MAYPPPRPTAPSSSSHLSSQEDVIDYLPDYQFWLSDLMMYQNFPAYGNDEQGETGIAMKAYTSEEDQVLIKQYEEKFFQLFTEYAQDNNVQIEEIRWKEEMLLVLCLKHIIPFLTWIRRSTSQIQHVKSLFLNHTDLRPEVRNGLLVILIHTFAAVKAKYFNEDNALKKSTEGTSSSQYLVTEELHEENMVSILQHPTKGLNISFQSIFKIIHDRHQFIAFLKNIILGLIELNLIPKNTRQKLILPTSSEGNIAISSRTAKDPSDENLVTNQEEYLAYLSLNSWLMTELADERNEAKIHVVRKIIQRFCGYWAMHSKVI